MRHLAALKLIILIWVALLIPIILEYPQTLAQTCEVDTTSKSIVTNGLISSSGLGADNITTNTGQCIIDPLNAPIDLSDAKIIRGGAGSYNTLKENFYNRSGVSDRRNIQKDIEGNPFTLGKIDRSLYYANGDIVINGLGLADVEKTSLIFIDGDLDITGNIIGSQPADKGLVFVVKGSIKIHQNVNLIHAVLIAGGESNLDYTICTTYDGTSCPTSAIVSNANALVVNGTLVSLNQSKGISFNRKLTNNIDSAEKINTQAKYLVILKGLMSSDKIIPFEPR